MTISQLRRYVTFRDFGTFNAKCPTSCPWDCQNANLELLNHVTAASLQRYVAFGTSGFPTLKCPVSCPRDGQKAKSQNV
jgi:hypothetical protein